MTNLLLNWNPNPASELVTHYNVFQTLDGLGPDIIATVTTNSHSIPNPAPGVYSFQIQAVNFVGVSGLSLAVAGPSAPSTPSTPTLTVVVS